MSKELEKAIAKAGIEEAERIIAKMEAAPKWDVDAWFRDLIEEMELRTHPDRPNINLWDGLVKGERVTLFEQDLETGIVWCRWKFMWMVYEMHYSPEYTVVQALLKDLLEEHFKWRVETTRAVCSPQSPPLEEHLKWKVETTELS